MKLLALDIWHDLRAKRMWPVAMVLLLALIAVPLVMLESSSEGADADPVAGTSTTAPSTAKLQVADASSELTGSRLDAFRPKDPFRPLIGARRDGTGAVARTALADLFSAASDSAGAGGGTGGGSGGGSTGGGGGGPTSPRPPKRQAFVYVADVTFGRVGHTREIRGLRRFEMLPNAEAPILVFLGVDGGGDNAVFLLDATVRQAGEGRCADAACSVLAIGAGSEHGFADQAGREYVLRIDQIRRVPAAQAASARVSKGARASASSSNGDDARAFVSDLLVDVVETVASTDAGTSRSGRDSR